MKKLSWWQSNQQLVAGIALFILGLVLLFIFRAAAVFAFIFCFIFLGSYIGSLTP